MLEQDRKIEFPFITLDRGISQSTGKRVLDYGPFFYFDAGPGDRLLHERFIELYKPNENFQKKKLKDF